MKLIEHNCHYSGKYELLIAIHGSIPLSTLIRFHFSEFILNNLRDYTCKDTSMISNDDFFSEYVLLTKLNQV